MIKWKAKNPLKETLIVVDIFFQEIIPYFVYDHHRW